MQSATMRACAITIRPGPGLSHNKCRCKRTQPPTLLEVAADFELFFVAVPIAALRVVRQCRRCARAPPRLHLSALGGKIPVNRKIQVVPDCLSFKKLSGNLDIREPRPPLPSLSPTKSPPSSLPGGPRTTTRAIPMCTGELSNLKQAGASRQTSRCACFEPGLGCSGF